MLAKQPLVFWVLSQHLAFVIDAYRVFNHEFLELRAKYGDLTATPARGGLGSLGIRKLAIKVAPLHGEEYNEKFALKAILHKLMARQSERHDIASFKTTQS